MTENHLLLDIMKSLSDIIYANDLHGNFLYWNSSAEEILRFSSSEIKELHIARIIPPSKIDEQKTIEEKIQLRQQVGPIETSRLTKDGFEVELSIIVTPLLDKTDNVVGMVTVAREMSLMRIAMDVKHQMDGLSLIHNERSSSDRRMRKFLDLAPEPILVVNRQDIIVFTNNRVSEVLGYTTEELKGKHLDILIPERYTVHHRKLADDYHNNPAIRPMGRGRILSAMHKNGEEIKVEVSLSPIDIPEEGAFVGIALRKYNK